MGKESMGKIKNGIMTPVNWVRKITGVPSGFLRAGIPKAKCMWTISVSLRSKFQRKTVLKHG